MRFKERKQNTIEMPDISNRNGSFFECAYDMAVEAPNLRFDDALFGIISVVFGEAKSPYGRQFCAFFFTTKEDKVGKDGIAISPVSYKHALSELKEVGEIILRHIESQKDK